MAPVSAASALPWQDGASLANLHAFRSREELEDAFADGVAQLLPGIDAALCMVEDDRAGQRRLEVRFAIGKGCPLRPLQCVDRTAWPIPDGQRLRIEHGELVLGELLLGSEPSPEQLAKLSAALTHFSVALVNQVLNTESRQATDEYCATLQALEQGIVLFQEPDAEAVMARSLALATSTVQAMAGALYVLDEVGNSESPLRLQQALGIPEGLLATFGAVDGSPWPDALLDSPTRIALPEDDGSIAGLAPECVPPALQRIAVLPLRYHGVQAGVCVLLNPSVEPDQEHVVIGRLQSFGQLTAGLLHRLSLEAMRQNSISIQRELEIANTIQQRLVPVEAPPSESFDFAWHSLAAKSIGGDYVDFLMAESGQLAAIVADASGHGINSALLMTSFRGNYRGSAAHVAPDALATILNNEVVHEVGPTGMFITAALVTMEAASRRLTLCSTGHNPVMLFRAATGTVEWIESHGPPMGFMAGVEFERHVTELGAGDVLLLYTDGITEATDADLEMFGEERLQQLLQQHAAGSAQSVLDAALAELVQFTGRPHQDDDVSLLVIKAL